jgi:Predicted amidohydrolase
MSTLSFTIIQTDLFWKDKIANLKMLEEKILSVKEKTQVVILPEMFSTGFNLNTEELAETMNGETIEWMKKISSQKKIILTGSIIVEDGGKYFNRLIWAQPNGNLGFYNKRHLFGVAGENENFTAGNTRFITSVNGWKINLQICYDLRFPVWARQQINNDYEYDVLINIANWPKARNHHWKTLLTARAIENQCFVIGVNRIGEDGNDVVHTGNSMIINAKGEILYSKEGDEDIFTITLKKDDLITIRNNFPFWKDADEFKILKTVEE